VLNTAEHTVTRFAIRVSSVTPFDVNALEKYRADMLQAWLDLIAQSLADAQNRFCESSSSSTAVVQREGRHLPRLLDLDANARVRSICEVEQPQVRPHLPHRRVLALHHPEFSRSSKLAVDKFCCLDIPEWFKKIKLPNENDPNRFNCGQTPDLSVIFDTIAQLPAGHDQHDRGAREALPRTTCSTARCRRSRSARRPIRAS